MFANASIHFPNVDAAKTLEDLTPTIDTHRSTTSCLDLAGFAECAVVVCLSGPSGLSVAVNVAAVVDAKQSDGDLVIVDCVDHSVLTAPGGVCTSKFSAQLFSYSVWILGQWPIYELEDRSGY